jgi:putative ABC transport system permease protein
MDRLLHDTRFALRFLLRSPGFALTAIATLAVGIGLATAVFTVAEALLLRRLPVRDQDRLVILAGESPDGRVTNYPISLDNAREFERRTQAVERVATVSYYGAIARPFREGDRLSTLSQSLVSGRFFDVLGARPLFGRSIGVEDDVQGAAPTAVLSFAAWQRRFGRDPAIIGRSLRMHDDGVSYTVVGVMPEGLDYPRGTDFWSAVTPSEIPKDMLLLGRLRAGSTVDQARQELTAFFARADAPAAQRGFRGTGETFPHIVIGDTRPALLTFGAAAALLLVLTGINVANLLLVRGVTRVREIAVRSAIGAARRRIVTQLLTENALLALAGGAAGIAVATAAVRVFILVAPTGTPRVGEITVNGAVLAGSIGIVMAAMLLFAIVPAFVTSRVSLQDMLRSEGRHSRGRVSRLASEGLVAGQVALALLVLSAAALIARSLINLERATLAFDAEALVIGELTGRSTSFAAPDAQVALLDRLVSRIGVVPGVRSVAPVVAVPFAGSHGWDGRFSSEGQPPNDAASNPLLNMELVTPAYFETLGIKLLRGRTFTDADRQDAPAVVVLSESAARAHWPGGDAIGKRLFMGSRREGPFTVVGIVPDTRYRELRVARPTVYFPLRQSVFPFTPGVLAVRVDAPPGDIVPALRRAVAETDPDVALLSAAPFERYRSGPLAQPRLNAALLAIFAAAAVMLASVGLFGVVAAMVRQRTREIGVRMALGASGRDVRRMVLGRGVAVAGIGAVLGALAALSANRLLVTMLYGVAPTDALTLAATAFVLLVVAGTACLVPARWSTGVDPLVALRSE